MAEFALQSLPVPAINSYPSTFQGLVDFMSTYLYFDDKINFKTYVKSLTRPVPTNENADKIWFKTSVGTGPIAIHSYANPNWVEFQSFKSGDMILTPVTATVASPWANPGQIYNLITHGGAGDTTTSLTAPSAPAPPAGFKYKVFVGPY